MIEVVRYDPDIKRLRTFIDTTDGIQFYTINNLYPQIVEAVRDRSYTVKSACDRMAKFLRGEGFEDKATADLIVNAKGQTLNNILKYLTVDSASYSGAFVAHLTVNMLGE
jgi:allophanate hydrolase subunit 2